MPDFQPYLDAIVFDPPVAYSAIGALALGIVLAVLARVLRRRRVSVWLWALALLGLIGGGTTLGFSLAGSLREVAIYAGAAAGVATGVVGLLVAMLLYSESRRPPFDVKRAVGRRAQVYQVVPPRGAGVGRVRVHAAGRSVLLSAVSGGPELPRYAFVDVKQAGNDGRVLVVPAA